MYSAGAKCRKGSTGLTWALSVPLLLTALRCALGSVLEAALHRNRCCAAAAGRARCSGSGATGGALRGWGSCAKQRSPCLPPDEAAAARGATGAPRRAVPIAKWDSVPCGRAQRQAQRESGSGSCWLQVACKKLVLGTVAGQSVLLRQKESRRSPASQGKLLAQSPVSFALKKRAIPAWEGRIGH